MPDIKKTLRDLIGTKTYLIGFTWLLSLTLIAINYFTHNYPGMAYFQWQHFYYLPPCLLLFICSFYMSDSLPGIAAALQTLWTIYMVAITLSIFCQAVQYTPFAVIDPTLLHLDNLLGFNSAAVINWTYQYPYLVKLSKFCYDMLGPEMVCLPIIVAFLLEKKAVDEYFIAFLGTMIIGFLIYYFWPTESPAAFIHNQYWLVQEKLIVRKFYDIHHHFDVTVFVRGFISFPSFHVIWASLLIYLSRVRKWLFYPILILNLLMISATLTLGWHYLADVIAGFLLTFIGIALTHCYLAKKH